MGGLRPQPTGGETEAQGHITLLLPPPPRSLPRQGTVGTLSPITNPGAAHTSLGRGRAAGAWLGWEQRWQELYLQAGMRGQAGTVLYQVTGRALEAVQGD